MTSKHRPAVVLVSGGLDSATTIAYAQSQGFICYALSIDYGQRHISELSFAKALCAHLMWLNIKLLKLT